MKYLFCIGLFFVLQAEQERDVWICVSDNATSYHLRESCQGLKRCTHTIKQVTESEAIGTYKRELCGYED